MRLTDEILKSKYGVSERALKIGREAQAQCASAFSQIEETAEFNQLKVLVAVPFGAQSFLSKLWVRLFGRRQGKAGGIVCAGI